MEDLFWQRMIQRCRPTNCSPTTKGREQWNAGFRFLKDTSFRVAEIFLKKTSRIQALAMVMVLCLFIYALTEFRLRQELVGTGETVTNQTKKQTQRPTMKWVFFRFRRVREFVVVVEGKRGETGGEPE